MPNLLDFETIATIMENTEEPDVDNESEKGIGSASVLPTLSIFCPKETFGIFWQFRLFWWKPYHIQIVRVGNTVLVAFGLPSSLCFYRFLLAIYSIS